MKALLTVLIACSTSLTLAPGQELSLFNGRDLSGWTGLPEYWSVKDGAITGRVTSNNIPPGQTDLVWQGGLVSDFELTCDAKMEDLEGTNYCNSGIYFRARVVNPVTAQMSGYQADLVLKSKMPTILGAMVGEFNGTEKMLTKVGEVVSVQPGGTIQVTGTLGDANKLLAGFKDRGWNTYRLTAVGNVLQCYINNRPTSSVTERRPDAAGAGMLGFQMLARKPTIVQFKNIKLRPLKPLVRSSPSVASAAPAVTIQTDAAQPRIEVIKDQGPNAAEWTLTPLEEAVPADIRQNLTVLREDLLDEAAKSAKSSPEAYKLAYDYCDKLLAALSQREIARSQAGYQSAQADAGKRTSTQALDARRNHQMSWPQFSREESQRAALRENESARADVKKQRLKMEWTTRAEQMRTVLDNTYRQLREAMR